jgi:hypothetical protein
VLTTRCSEPPPLDSARSRSSRRVRGRARMPIGHYSLTSLVVAEGISARLGLQPVGNGRDQSRERMTRLRYCCPTLGSTPTRGRSNRRGAVEAESTHLDCCSTDRARARSAARYSTRTLRIGHHASMRAATPFDRWLARRGIRAAVLVGLAWGILTASILALFGDGSPSAFVALAVVGAAIFGPWALRIARRRTETEATR